MTKRLVRDLVMLGIGAAVGSVSSYIILKRQYNKELEAETKETREFCRSQIAKYKQEKDIAQDYADKLQAMVVEEEEPEINPDERAEYEAEAAKYEHPTDDEPEPKIYLISQEEFDEQHPEYSKIVLINYAIDGTLATDAEEIVDDPHQLVGDCLDEQNAIGAWKVCYVRNDRTSVDYEINNLLGSFPSD